MGSLSLSIPLTLALFREGSGERIKVKGVNVLILCRK
jgi:hypothetical protein